MSFTLIGGGARSGKSAFALKLAMRYERRLFVATAEAFDDEMRARIDRHVAERGADFTTLEAPRDLDVAIARISRDADVVVIDCITLWLSNLLLADVTESVIDRRVDALANALASAPFRSIVVTNEVGMGIVPETPLGRAFRDVSGRAHQRLARAADEIYFAAVGTMMRLRPEPISLMRDAP